MWGDHPTRLKQLEQRDEVIETAALTIGQLDDVPVSGGILVLFTGVDHAVRAAGVATSSGSGDGLVISFMLASER